MNYHTIQYIQEYKMYIVALISLILILHSCKNSEERSSRSPDNKTADTLQQMPQTKKDTIPKVPAPGRGLAPGQARVEADIIAISPPAAQSDSVQTLRLHIRRILDYGPSAPPIPPGDTLNTGIGFKNDPNDLREGLLVQAKLQYNISFPNKDGGPEWSLISIEK